MRGGRRWSLGLWLLTAVLSLGLVVKFFVADVYRVESGSMRPTIFGGKEGHDERGLNERVLVLYDRAPDVERFDLVVMQSRDGGKPLVKRVAALPGESVLVASGDLVVDGRRLPEDAARPEPVVVFDDRLLEVGQYFSFKNDSSVQWTQDGESWELDARSVPRDANGGMMFFQRLNDDYLGVDHRPVHGLRQVNDGILECDVRMDAEASDEGRLRFQLVEAGDTFQALVAREEDGFHLVLRRLNTATLKETDPGRRSDVLLDRPIQFEAGKWHHVLFANIDNYLSFELDDFRVGVGYKVNETYPTPAGSSLRSIGPRVAFGGEACRARFRSIVVLRDLYYTSDGRFAVSSLLTLGPDEYFLLGDNSSDSTDSRHFGPVRAAEIVGVPVAVVWPMSRFRWLRGGLTPPNHP